MATFPDTRQSFRPALVAGVLAAAYLATRIALISRFPWFVDETTFASFAKEVHGDIGQFFIAETDKKGLLPSWLGAALIGTGASPVTAMRLLAAAGAAAAAVCGGLLVRRLYGLREALLTAGLIALGPYFLVTASVGVYDAMVGGLVTAAVLLSIRLARRPRVVTAVVLGGVLGAGALTKPTAWAAVAVLPCTLLLFDRDAPQLRRRLIRWAGLAVLAVGLGYAIASIARLTPLYDQPAYWEGDGYHSYGPIPVHHGAGLGRLVGDAGRTLISNAIWTVLALVGYLTPPGALLAVLGGVVAWRRRRSAAAILAIWALAVIASALVLAPAANPRYFAAAIVPLAAFVAIGALAVWDAILTRRGPRRFARTAACAVAALALLPAVVFNTHVLSDPAHASYPGLDEPQYVTQQSALGPLATVAQEIERRGGPYPVQIDAGPYPRRNDIGPWGLDLLLNGAAVGSERQFEVFVHGTPAQLRRARYLVTDGERADRPPRPGYRLLRRLARADGGAVMRLYIRS